jgi:hypothetical protein
MQHSPNSEADARYLEMILEDCGRVLGAGIDIERVELETNDEVVLRLRYRLGTREGSSEGSSEGRGESLLAAHTALRQRLVEDRIALGFRAIVIG